MKFKKCYHSVDDMMITIEMRKVFNSGRSYPIKWDYEEIESFVDIYHFGYATYNRKRDLYSYYKQLFRRDFSDGECEWDGEDE